MKGRILVVGAALALLACSKRPACRGEISHDDLVRLQARAAKGDEQVCRELLRATIKVDDEGVVLNGARIHTILDAKAKQNVPALRELLQKDRETWKAIYPGRDFVAPVDLEVPAVMEVGPGVSVASTLASTGYRQLNVHSGDLTMKLDYWVRSPPDADPRELVHVEVDGVTGSFLVRFGGETTARTGHRHDARDRDAAAKAIASEWSSTTRDLPRGLVLRIPKGSFHDALALARSFLALPELAGATVAFEIGEPSRGAGAPRD